MRFGEEKNLIHIIMSGLSNYEKYLLNKKFIFVYYNNDDDSYEYIETVFSKAQFKHLCGISDDEKDIEVYTKAGIVKEIVSAKDFFKLCKKNRLAEKHIIVKRDGTTIQKMNILNNLYKLTNSETLYCNIGRIKKDLDCNAMIGLKGGNISLALRQVGNASVPISSLNFDIADTGEKLYKIVLVACKESEDSKYQEIKINKVSLSNLPENIKLKFDVLVYDY